MLFKTKEGYSPYCEFDFKGQGYRFNHKFATEDADLIEWLRTKPFCEEIVPTKLEKLPSVMDKIKSRF